MSRMVPIPVSVDKEHCLYIDVRDSVLCLDQAKQYYFTLKENEVPKCRSAEPGHYVCTHPRTLLSVPAADSCAVTLLQKRKRIPDSCETRLVRLSNTVWTQLASNSWIFYAPHTDVMTIVRHGNNPVDINLKGVGKLQLFPGCKGYSTNALLYGSSVAGNTGVQIPGDLLSQIDIQYACCEELGVKINISQIPVGVAYRKTIAHLDDLRLASARVSDLLEAVDEQDWKNRLVTHRNTHSVLLVLIVSLTFIYWLFKLYICLCKRTPICLCKRRVPEMHSEAPQVVGLNVLEDAAKPGGNSEEVSSAVVNPTPTSSLQVLPPRATTSLF